MGESTTPVGNRYSVDVDKSGQSIAGELTASCATFRGTRQKHWAVREDEEVHGM